MTECSKLILYICFPSTGVGHFPSQKNPGFFHWKMVSGTKIWASCTRATIGGWLLLGSLSKQSYNTDTGHKHVNSSCYFCIHLPASVINQTWAYTNVSDSNAVLHGLFQHLPLVFCKCLLQQWETQLLPSPIHLFICSVTMYLCSSFIILNPYPENHFQLLSLQFFK